MKKAWIISIGLIVVVVAVGAWLAWTLASQPTQAPQQIPNTSDTASQSSAPPSPSVAGSTQMAINIKDQAFSPASIKIKKGTTVTWTNQDSMGHNVVADESGNVTGLPTQNELIGNGETYSFTFNTVGIVNYHCTPHPFMKGIIEVVE